MPVRHMLIEATVDRGRRHFTCRCGATFSVKTHEPLPDDVTGWGSLVTCRECR